MAFKITCKKLLFPIQKEMDLRLSPLMIVIGRFEIDM